MKICVCIVHSDNSQTRTIDYSKIKGFMRIWILSIYKSRCNKEVRSQSKKWNNHKKSKFSISMLDILFTARLPKTLGHRQQTKPRIISKPLSQKLRMPMKIWLTRTILHSPQDLIRSGWPTPFQVYQQTMWRK